jgi:ribosomal protein L23
MFSTVVPLVNLKTFQFEHVEILMFCESKTTMTTNTLVFHVNSNVNKKANYKKIFAVEVLLVNLYGELWCTQE